MLTVLIAEDNIVLADLLEEYLTSHGYDVCGSASTVAEAVALADLHKPDLAVLDFRLRNGEFGSQIHARIKDKRHLGTLYVSGDPLDGKLTKENGEAYIQKPYRMRDLNQALCIVGDVKNNRNFLPSTFPENFHLIENDNLHKIAA